MNSNDHPSGRGSPHPGEARRLISDRLAYSPLPVTVLNPVQLKTRNHLLHAMVTGSLSLERTYCLCGGSGETVLAERDRWGFPVDLLLCNSCGLLRTSPRMVAAALPNFYAEKYRLLMDGASEVSNRGFELQSIRGEEAFRFILQEQPLAPGSRVYELGASAGGVLQPFHRAGHVVEGFDWDEGFLRYGRLRGLPMSIGGLEEMGRRPPADLLILSHVLEHSNDPIGMLRDASACLKADGRIFLAVPGVDHVEEDYDGDLAVYLQMCHTFHFSLATISAVASAAGLRVVSSDPSIRLILRKNPTGASAFSVDDRGVEQRLRDLEARWRMSGGFLRLGRRVKRIIYHILRGAEAVGG